LINFKKNIYLSLIFIFLIIPIFFGVYVEYLYVYDSSLLVIFILVLGLIFFLILDEITVLYCYNEQSVEAIKKHDVINALIKKKNKEIIWIFLPMIIIIEELIFRYYLIGFFINQLDFDIISAIFISSFIFSSYHIHIWFRFKNLRILMIYLVDSFFLGLFNGYILLTLGLISCILIHYSIVLLLYYGIYKRYFKSNLDIT